jgi:hypothetical protein
MITDPQYFSSFKREALSRERLSLDYKYRILESLYDEARALGSFTDKDILLGLDDDIRLASALNSNVPGTSL